MLNSCNRIYLIAILLIACALAGSCSAIEDDNDDDDKLVLSRRELSSRLSEDELRKVLGHSVPHESMLELAQVEPEQTVMSGAPVLTSRAPLGSSTPLQAPSYRGGQTDGAPRTGGNLTPAPENVGPKAGGQYEDDIVLSRLDLARLSQTRMQVKRLPLEKKCGIFIEQFNQMLGDKANPDERAMVAQVVRLLSRRKLPFGNSQPVLGELEACLATYEFRSNKDKEDSAQLQVIASPPTTKQTEPDQSVEGMKNAFDEFKAVRNNVKDFGQDIYLPGNTVPGAYRRPLGGPNSAKNVVEVQHDDQHVYEHALATGDEIDKRQQDLSDVLERVDNTINNEVDELEDLNEAKHNYDDEHQHDKDSEQYNRSNDRKPQRDDGVHNKLRQNDDDGEESDSDRVNEKEQSGDTKAVLEEKHREIVNLRLHVAELRNRVDRSQSELARARDETLRAKAEAKEARSALQNSAGPSASLERARTEALRVQYDAVVKREENLLKLLNEYRSKAEEQEAAIKREFDANRKGDASGDDDEKDSDKKAYDDPEDVASRLAQKFDLNEDLAKRCQRYYLIFSYPKKVTRYVIKTVAKLKVYGVGQTPADYSRVLGPVASVLIDSAKKKKAYKVGQDIQECLELQKQQEPPQPPQPPRQRQKQQQAQDATYGGTQVNVNSHDTYNSESRSTQSTVYKIPIHRPHPPMPPFPAFPHFSNEFRYRY